MNLVWKIVIGIIITLVVAAIAFFVWFTKVYANVGELKIEKEDTHTVKIEKADQWLTTLNKKCKFNGAVLLIKDDEVLLKQAYGFESHSKTTPLTTNSSFRLASVSKQFTAAGIMLLKEKGLLNFDDAITDFLPELPYKNVTIRHLLNHTSEIPDVYMNFPEMYKDEVGDILNIDKMVTIYGAHTPDLNGQPNDQYQYSNTGYVLLAAIIQKVSGVSFEKFMSEEIFKPLKMNNTRVWNLMSSDTDFEGKTSSFENIMCDSIELKPTALDGVAGDGSVFSSVEDFIIWNKFWNENNLISEETLAEAFKKPILNDGSESDYGFGWFITDNGMLHNGSWLGARTIIIRNTTNKNCLVVLGNSANMNIDAIAEELAKVFIK